jgi:RNA polymerase sigma-70 factor, ECF subfamily
MVNQGVVGTGGRARGSARSARVRSPGPQGAVNRVSVDGSQLPGDEAGLIRAAQTGSREAFAGLVERYWERLYRWLCHLTRDSHGAEDLAQETFLKAFAALESFRAGSNFRAWLFRIAHNNFVNQKRAARFNRQPLSLEAPHGGPGPVEEMLSREALQLLAKAVAKLPPDFRSALLLRVDEELSFKEIAEVLEVTEETARWRVFKARQKLMTVLAPELLPRVAPPEPNANQP